MPARTSLTPCTVPVRLALFLRLPEHEIERILLLILTGYEQRAVASLQVIQILVGQLAVFLEATGAEINRAILRHIGMILVKQRLDHLKHSGDFLRRKRMFRCRAHIHRRHVFLALLDKTFGDHGSLNAFLVCLFDDLVVHICKVGHVIHFIPLIFHVAAHRIKYDHRTRIADMDQIVHGRTAYIHFDFARL